MLSKSLIHFRPMRINKILEIMILILISTLLLFPVKSYCQIDTETQIIKETKKFLKEINSSTNVQYGAIIIAPKTHHLLNILYDTPHGVENIPPEPHSQFIISKKVNLNKVTLNFEESTIDLAGSVPLDTTLNGKLIFIGLDVSSVKLDTFKIKSPKYIPQEKRELLKILGYSLMPGGGRFYAGKNSQGWGVAILQLSSIGLAIHYNNQQQKYFDMAIEAANLRNQSELDKNFEKYKKFSLYTGIAVGIAAAASFFNICDVLINVKDIQCEPFASANGIGVQFSKK